MYPVLFFVVQPVFLSIIILGLILSILSGLYLYLFVIYMYLYIY